MPPFNVQRIDHVVLRVADLERSIAFYRALLGCEPIRRRDDLGLVHLRAGASMIDLVAVAGPLGQKGGAAAGTTGRNMDHLCLRVDPFDGPAILAFLQEQGVAHTGSVQSNFGAEGTGPSLYFTDPDGNEIELKGPADAPTQPADRFDHVFIQPGSFDASLAFYRDALGWQLQFSWGDGNSPRGACLSSGGMTVVIAESHPAGDRSKTHGVAGTRPTLHLRVDDAQARYDAIRRSGRALFPPERNHWGTLWFVAEDPDGNLIAFEQNAPR